MTKLVVVFTATGARGFPIVKYLTANYSDTYRVRALTRDASKEFASLGAEVVEYSLDDDASVERAVSGANIVFANTDFWSVLTVEGDIVDPGYKLKSWPEYVAGEEDWSSIL